MEVASSGEGKLSPLPDPLDVQQATEEAVAGYILELLRCKAERNAAIPRLIARHANAKRDLDVAKSQLKYLEESIRGSQSVLRSIRP